MNGCRLTVGQQPNIFHPGNRRACMLVDTPITNIDLFKNRIRPTEQILLNFSQRRTSFDEVYILNTSREFLEIPNRLTHKPQQSDITPQDRIRCSAYP